MPDGFFIRSIESVALGLEQGGDPQSAARELRRLAEGMAHDETEAPK